jgi:hypothetical protein
MKSEHKSQLAKDLSSALFVCGLRDDLKELAEDLRVSPEIEAEIRKCYIKAVVLLACAIVGSKQIKEAMGQ